MSVVAKCQDPGRADFSFFRQPLLWPEEIKILVFRPCLPAGPSESMDEDDVCRTRANGRVQHRQPLGVGSSVLGFLPLFTRGCG